MGIDKSYAEIRSELLISARAQVESELDRLAKENTLLRYAINAVYDFQCAFNHLRTEKAFDQLSANMVTSIRPMLAKAKIVLDTARSYGMEV